MKKKITVIMIILLLVFVAVGPVFAEPPYYYYFIFDPPFAGSMNWDSPSQFVSGSSSYVDPNGSSAETNYFLTTQPGEIILATYILYEVETTTKRYFTYQTGYGGIGQKYCLAGYPSNYDFNYYTISGYWLP